ncbi:TRAP transporter substrate-binding protein DctP [Deltaproteobacteria bacterium]|nr:TRAP transporter substrate-binding protein DctP [Deltaproteobacteria bacterium]
MDVKKIFRVRQILLIPVLITLMLCFSCSRQQQDIFTITYLTPWPKNAYDSNNFVNYIEEIQKEADQQYPGEIEFIYKGGPEVVHSSEQVEACRKGVVSMLLAAPSYYSSVMPELDLLGLTSMKPWEQRETGLFEYLDELHNEKTNTHYLGQPGIGVPFQMHLSKPIESAEDLNGMKLRVSPTNNPFMKAVDGVPVVMPTSDIYTAMERGVVEGFVLPAYTAKDFGLVKVTDYLVFPGLYYPTNSWLINLDTWNSLPEYLQDFLLEKAEEYEYLNFSRIAERHATEMEFFRQEGVTIIELDSAEAEKLIKIAREALIAAVREKSPEETDRILSFIEKEK